MSNKKAPAGSLGARGGHRQAAHRGAYVHPKCTRIFVNGQVVGEVRKGVFRKKVRSSRHMLRRPLAWAVDLRSLQDAEAAGALTVELRDVDTGATYRATIADIWERGFELERGYGQQVALTLECWHVEFPGQASQLQMFGGASWKQA